MALGNDPTGVFDGVDITGGSNDTIGGVSSVDAHGNLSGLGNLISGNVGTTPSALSDGLLIETASNVVQGNFMGTTVKGTTVLANARDGIDLQGANNLIGGTAPGQGNVISGNGIFGIGIGDSGNLVEGNLVGTDVTGTVALGNGSLGGYDGILVVAAANTIGGTAAGAGNVISGSSGNGLRFLGTGASGNVVEGNYVGTNAHGNTLLSGTAAWYKGEGNANDSVNGNNGSIQGGVTFAPGEVGQAFSFNGVDGEVKVPDAGTLDPSTISVALWVNSSTAGPGEYLLSKGASGDQFGSYALDTASSVNGDLYFDIYVQGVGLVRSPAAAHASVFDGHWHLVVGTYDNQTVRLYVDGVQVGTGTPTSGGIQYGLPTQNNLLLGNYDNGGASSNNYHYSGLLDEVTIYNRALSATEVHNDFTAGSAGMPNALGNQGNGVEITGGATGNTIGGTAAGAGNVISGQYNRNIGAAGVFVGGQGDTTTTGNLIAGNLIGTDATGTRAEGNQNGVWLEASGNTVGGTTAGARNVISGNDQPRRAHPGNERRSGLEQRGRGQLRRHRFVRQQLRAEFLQRRGDESRFRQHDRRPDKHPRQRAGQRPLGQHQRLRRRVSRQRRRGGRQPDRHERRRHRPRGQFRGRHCPGNEQHDRRRRRRPATSSAATSTASPSPGPGPREMWPPATTSAPRRTAPRPWATPPMASDLARAEQHVRPAGGRQRDRRQRLLQHHRRRRGPTLLQGNIVGLNAAGAAALGCRFRRRSLRDFELVTIGGTAAGAGNVFTSSSLPEFRRWIADSSRATASAPTPRGRLASAAATWP